MASIWSRDTLTSEAVEELKDEIIGKNVLITGVTIGGLGFEAAFHLSKYAATAILVGSSLERLQISEDKIKADVKEANLIKIVADLSSLKAVRTAVQEIKALNLPLHVIIASAVARARPEYAVSAEGYEMQFAVDHLAHFVLVNSLLPRVSEARAPASAPTSFAPRLVMISSMAQRHGGIQFDDLNFNDGKDYNAVKAYAQAKTANILYAQELARRLGSKGILAFSVHPGAIRTNGFESLGFEEKVTFGIWNPDGTINDKLILKRLDQGAVSSIHGSSV